MQVSFTVPDDDGEQFLASHPNMAIGAIAKASLYRDHGMDVPVRGTDKPEQDAAELVFLAIKARGNHNRLGAVDYARAVKLATKLGKLADIASIRESVRN